jgi:hypothetical protein
MAPTSGSGIVLTPLGGGWSTATTKSALAVVGGRLVRSSDATTISAGRAERRFDPGVVG